MQRVVLWRGPRRTVELGGVASIQWHEARTMIAGQARLHRYTRDLLEWAAQEANEPYDDTLPSPATHVRFGCASNAKFLYIREADVTLILFLNDLFRAPEAHFDALHLRH